MRADREHAARAPRASAWLTARSWPRASPAEVDEVVGDVDVEREVAVAHDAQRRDRAGGPRPRGGGTSRVRRRSGSRRRSGTESTGVPSSRWQGTSATTGCAPSRASAGEVARVREVGVGDRRRGRSPRSRKRSRPGGGGGVERAGVVEHVELAGRRPTSRTSASDDTTTTGSGAGGRARPARPSAGRARRASAASSASARRALPERERADRDHDPGACSARRDASVREESGNIAARMLPTVESADVRGRDRRRVVGHHRRRDHERARADARCGAATPSWSTTIADRARELALPRRASRCPTRCAPPTDLDAACAGADVVVMAVPSHGYRAVLERGRAVDRAPTSRS